MFCKNCGAQLPDGSISCDACGTILAENNEAAQVDNTEYLSYSEMSSQSSVNALNGTAADKPKKDKNNNFLIIALVSVILLVAIVITAVILFVRNDRNKADTETTGNVETTTTTVSAFSDDEETAIQGISTTDPTTETTSSTTASTSGTEASSTQAVSQGTTEKTQEKVTVTTPSSKPAESRPSIYEAERIAKNYGYNICTQDLVPIIEAEVIGMSAVSKKFDEFAVKSTGASSVSEAYAILSKSLGSVKVNNARDYINAMSMLSDYDGYLSSVYGSNYTITTTVNDSYYVSASDAASYVNKAKASINKVVPSNTVAWSGIKDYAMVEMTVKISGSKYSDYCRYNVLFGHLNGEWRIVYYEENGIMLDLNTVVFLKGVS